jgi:23S rRNA (cytidine1920-2'-O)/16S rRNA (cytidine1409-2'-O)-methyltransferase
MTRKRLASVLVDRGLVATVEEALDLIGSDRVTVNGAIAANPDRRVAISDQIEISTVRRFVSRGGEKLDHAFTHWPISVDGEVAVDLGSSTGGFTDCLLQMGARRVVAVDVGENQLHERLLNDPRVEARGGINVKDIHLLPAVAASFVTVDLSFISVLAAIPAIKKVAAPRATVVVLVKPQFEATRSEADRFGGVIVDEEIRERVVSGATDVFIRERFEFCGRLESPVRGAKGNIEFLLWFRTPVSNEDED